MRFTVTPLGSATGRPVHNVIDDLVAYLRQPSRTAVPLATATAPAGPPSPAPTSHSEPEATQSARRYYADSGEGPGGWRGLGAAALGLSGEVDDEAFARLLAGRHPHTGERLLEAHPFRPSTAKVAVVLDGDPTEELSLADAARLAGLSKQYLRRMCRTWVQRRDQIKATIAAGSKPSFQYLVCTRRRRGYRVTREELAAFLIRRKPPAVRIGFDLTATTEKSVGILGLLTAPAIRAAVLHGVSEANDAGLHYLEQHAAWARAKGRRVGVAGWTVASFRHLTSRALDPFPHHHNVVANVVADEEGTHRALDGRGLYHYARDASLVATAELRYRLTATLGVDWERSPTGTWEIAGITREAIREFSRRANEIADAVHELEQQTGRAVTIDELRRLVTQTRPAKQHVDPDDLVAGWWERAQRVRLSPEVLAACLGRREPTIVDDAARTRLFDHLARPNGVTAHASTFTRADVLAAIIDYTEPVDGRDQLWVLPAARALDLADEFLCTDRVLRLARSQRRTGDVIRRRDGRVVDSGFRDPTFTTPDIVAAQERILANYQRRRYTAVAQVPLNVLADAVARHPTLSDEQRALVRALGAGGHGVHCAIGRPGAGKTYALRAAAAAWTAAGYRVVGAAVKGDAARHLATETGIPSETVAWYLAHDDPQRLPFDARTVVLVDEAGTIGDRDLDRLLAIAERTGAAVRLVGDPHQHGAVAAGGMFRLICERHSADTPELTHGRRVQHPGDWAAAEALRDGRIADALGHLADAGHLHLARRPAAAYLDVLERWWRARETGDHHPMVDRRNAPRRHLNHLAHRLLQTSGEIGREELTVSEGLRFAVGDQVIARRGDRRLHRPGCPSSYVRNGATGTIIKLRPAPTPEDDVIVVDFAELGTINLPRTFFDLHTEDERVDVGLDHAYAVTSYSSQGRTYPLSTSVVDSGATRPEFYVDITRGQQANHVYLAGIEPEDPERLPRLPAPPLVQQVTVRLSASGPERTAIELDPDVGEAGRLAHGRTLSELRAERRRLETTGQGTTLIARAERLVAARIAWAARRNPPLEITAHLPPRPAAPHLRRRWDTAIATVAVYRARWQPEATVEGWGTVLGPVPSDPDQAHHHNEALRHLRGVVASYYPAQLGHVGPALVLGRSLA